MSASAVLWIALSAGAAPEAPGVVVTLGDTPAPPLTGATWTDWRHEGIPPRPRPRSTPPTAALESLRRQWEDASFARCLASARSLELDALLAAGHRAAAAELIALDAGCALGVGDGPLAQALLRRAHAADLDLVPALSRMTSDVQRAWAEVASSQAGLHVLVLETAPEGAMIVVDGEAAACPSTPCTLRLRPGRHVLRATRLGVRPRVVTIDLTADTTRRLALDPAPSETLRAQLAYAVAEGAPPDDPRLARLASAAFARRLTVLVGRSGTGFRGQLFDVRAAQGPRVMARAQAGSVEAVLASLRSTWENEQPRALLAEPLFWVGAAAVVSAVAVGTFLVVRRPEPTLSLVGTEAP